MEDLTDLFDLADLINEEKEISDSVQYGYTDVEQALGLNALREKVAAKEKSKAQKRQKLAQLEFDIGSLQSSVEDIINEHGIQSTVTINKSEIFAKGIKKIWETDRECQLKALRIYLEEIRKYEGEYLEEYLKYMEKLGAFVIINEAYMPKAFGDLIKNDELGVYFNNVNRYGSRLMMPLTFMDGSIQGLVGYSPTSSIEQQTIKYLYPVKQYLEKRRILFCPPEVYAKAIRDGYICITDGLFDSISLNIVGINAASLCGSALTSYHKLMLSKIKKKIVSYDNDKAGEALYAKCKDELDSVTATRQLITKDIDDYLKDANRRKYFLERFEEWRSIGFIGELNL